MRRQLGISFLVGLAFGLGLFVGSILFTPAPAQVFGGNWKSPFGTAAYGPPAAAQMIAFPQVTTPTFLGPFTCAGVLTTGTGQPCEGRLACNIGGTIVCVATVAP